MLRNEPGANERGLGKVSKKRYAVADLYAYLTARTQNGSVFNAHYHTNMTTSACLTQPTLDQSKSPASLLADCLFRKHSETHRTVAKCQGQKAKIRLHPITYPAMWKHTHSGSWRDRPFQIYTTQPESAWQTCPWQDYILLKDGPIYPTLLQKLCKVYEA